VHDDGIGAQLSRQRDERLGTRRLRHDVEIVLDEMANEAAFQRPSIRDDDRRAFRRRGGTSSRRRARVSS